MDFSPCCSRTRMMLPTVSNCNAPRGRGELTDHSSKLSTVQSADTRTRLIVTAMQLFWEKGYGSTSVADVLQAARVNSGSLYHFFPGKQDLQLAVLDMYQGGLRTMLLEPAWRGVTDPIERVFALLARYRRSLADTDC